MQHILLLAFLLLTFGSQAEPVMEVITVNNRPAEELRPLLLPLLENNDQVVANGDSLIVKTAAERLPTITSLIRKLDKPLNNLFITVVQSRDLTAEQLNTSINFDIHAPVNIPGRPQGYAQGYYNQSQGQSSINNSQTIRTLEGAPAHINVGNVVPITNYQVYPDAYGYPYQNRITQLVDATTGFEVTPRLVGQQVEIEVAPWSDRFNNQGNIETHSANTTIRANLGEWVDLAGVTESGQNSGYTTFGYHRGQGQNDLHILVKVDKVN